MENYLEYEDGTLVHVSVPVDRLKTHEMRKLREIAGDFATATRTIGEKVRETSQAIQSAVADADEIEIEIGFQVEASSGVPAIASLNGEMHFRVTCKWSKKV